MSDNKPLNPHEDPEHVLYEPPPSGNEPEDPAKTGVFNGEILRLTTNMRVALKDILQRFDLVPGAHSKVMADLQQQISDSAYNEFIALPSDIRETEIEPHLLLERMEALHKKSPKTAEQFSQLHQSWQALTANFPKTAELFLQLKAAFRPTTDEEAVASIQLEDAARKAITRYVFNDISQESSPQDKAAARQVIRDALRTLPPEFLIQRDITPLNLAKARRQMQEARKNEETSFSAK